MGPNAKDMHILELFVLHFIFEHLVESTRSNFSVWENKGQFKNFGTRETTRGIANYRPNNIDNAICDLLDQFRGPASELHRRIPFDFDTAAGIALHIVGPYVQNVLGHVSLGRQKLM